MVDKALIDDWKFRSDESLRSAGILNRTYPQPVEIICGLAHQSAELAVKGVCAARYPERAVLKKHDLTQLINLCGLSEIDSEVLLAVEFLRPYDGNIRYPGNLLSNNPSYISVQAAGKAIDAAEIVNKWAEKEIDKVYQSTER